MSKCQPDETTIEIVCNYMKQQNRPYSAVDVWNNLRQEFPKAQVVKCLDAGVERGILREKLISKQKIYFADQSKIERCDEEKLQAMAKAIEEKRSQLNMLNNELKTLKNELKIYENTLSIEEMISLRTTLNAQIAEMEERIGVMEADAKNVIIDEAMKCELIAKQELYKKLYKERKRIAEHIVDTISENTDIPKKKLMEEMGFELD